MAAPGLLSFVPRRPRLFAPSSGAGEGRGRPSTIDHVSAAETTRRKTVAALT